MTHTLVAATLARTPLRHAGRGTTAALILSSNAPDIDIVTAIEGAVSYLQWHRGPTHGLVGLFLVGLLTAALVRAGQRVFGRGRGGDTGSFGALACVSVIGSALHVTMDLPTSYGTRLLNPFDWHWYAFDVMPIIDVYLIGILLLCLWLGAVGSSGRRRERFAAAALVLMLGNYGIRTAAHRRALQSAAEAIGPRLPAPCVVPGAEQAPVIERWPRDPAVGQGAASRCLVEVAAIPTFFSPFRWRVIARVTDSYESAEIDLLTRATSRSPAIPNAWTPAAKGAASSETARIFLGFSRFPAVQTVTDNAGVTVVQWRDIRFQDSESSAAPARRRGDLFTVTVRLAPDGRILDERLGS